MYITDACVLQIRRIGAVSEIRRRLERIKKSIPAEVMNPIDAKMRIKISIVIVRVLFIVWKTRIKLSHPMEHLLSCKIRGEKKKRFSFHALIHICF
jgi:hypothetical protein